MEWYETHRHIFTDEKIQKALMISKKEKIESSPTDSDFIPYYENRIKNITKNLNDEIDQKAKEKVNMFTMSRKERERIDDNLDDDEEGQKDKLTALS
jgi:hypothetical protein